MESCYINLVAGLTVFFMAIMVYIKFKFQQSFVPTNIPGIQDPPGRFELKQEPNVYETEDTRMVYPLKPPVNPNIRNSRVLTNISSDPDLYNNQGYSTNYHLLNVPGVETNDLLYSGGETEMIDIPLQLNEPYNEHLRSQKVLITPFNKVKYGV